MTSATSPSIFKSDLTLAEAIEALYAPFPAEDHEFHPYFKIVYLKEEAINRRLTSVFGFGWSKVIVKQEYHKEGLPTITVKNGTATYNLPLDQYPGEVIRKDGLHFIKKTITKQIAKFGEDGKPVLSETSKKPITESVQEEVEQPVEVLYDIPYIVSQGYMEVRFADQVGRRDDVGADVLTDLGKERGAREHNTWKTSSTDLLKRLARQFGVGLYLTEVKGATVKVVDYRTLALWLKEAYGIESKPEPKQPPTGQQDPEKKKADEPAEITREQFIAGALKLGYADEAAVTDACKANTLSSKTMKFAEMLAKLPKPDAAAA